MNSFTFFESSQTPWADMTWLGRVPLESLATEVQRRLDEAFVLGDREGYRRGVERSVEEAEERARRYAEAKLASQDGQLHDAYLRGQHEAEERIRAEYEQIMREAERQRAEASLQEAEERGLRFDRMMKEREKAIEERLRKEFLAAKSEESIRLVRTSGIHRGVVDAAKLDATRKQAYQNGFEQGMAIARREFEATLQSHMRDARRQGYLEGIAEGRRSVLGVEGSRSWALGVLHLGEGCTADDVRNRYRKLSRSLHPDQNPGIEDTFIKNLNRAKDILGD